MELDEHIALQMAKERVDEELRAAAQRSARLESAGPPVRSRLGGVLARLGNWIKGHV